MKTNLLAIESYLNKKFGIFIDDKKKNTFYQFIIKRITATRMKNEYNYFRYIKSKQGIDELQKLIGFFTVGETYFLRNNDHWQAFTNYVIPEIVKNKKDNRLKIWSAGCSTGEEAYTIAIMLYENLPFFLNWDITILATDINMESLYKAKNGIYTKNAFRETPISFRKKYFSKIRDSFKIDKRFKGMVEFENLNLISETGYSKKYSNFDIIFCRNVLIYFSPEIYKMILKSLSNCLNIDNYLFLGHVEGPMAKGTNFKPVSRCNTFIYKNTMQEEKIKKIHKNLSIETRIINKYLPDKKNKLMGEKKFMPLLITNSDNKRVITFNKNLEIITKKIYDQALSLYLNGKLEEAHQILKQNKAECDIEKFNVLILTGLIYIYKRDFKNASLCYNKALMAYDLTPETYMLGAIINEEKRNFQKAIEDCNNAIFLDKNFFYPHFRLGAIYNKIGNKKKMHKSYKNALKILNLEKKDRLMLFCEGFTKKSLKEFLVSI